MSAMPAITPRVGSSTLVEVPITLVAIEHDQDHGHEHVVPMTITNDLLEARAWVASSHTHALAIPGYVPQWYADSIIRAITEGIA